MSSRRNLYERVQIKNRKNRRGGGQPWNENHLRPCPLLDNPEKLAEAVDKSGAHSTDLESPEDVHDLTKKCVPAAERWAVTADRLWSCSHNCANCGK